MTYLDKLSLDRLPQLLGNGDAVYLGRSHVEVGQCVFLRLPVILQLTEGLVGYGSEPIEELL